MSTRSEDFMLTMPSTTSQLSPKMDSVPIPIPSPRRVRPLPTSRQHSSGTAAALRLPSLPRFHPANYPSQNSTPTTTPATGPNSPQPPLSPRTFHKQYSEAQRHVYLYSPLSPSRESRGPVTKPTSPRLVPMGSPGPVTPLELEGEDGYLTAGVASGDAASHVDKLIKEEALRRGEVLTQRTTSVGGR